jgi:hypothetical protein
VSPESSGAEAERRKNSAGRRHMGVDRVVLPEGQDGAPATPSRDDVADLFHTEMDPTQKGGNGYVEEGPRTFRL